MAAMILPATQAAILIIEGAAQMTQIYQKGAISETALQTILTTLGQEIVQATNAWNAAGTTAAAVKADGPETTTVAVP